MAQQSTSSSTSHAGVWIPPPLLYIVPFLAAWLLHALVPLPLLPAGIALVLTFPLLALGIILCVWSIGLFRHFKTSLVPVRPTAALVLSGPYQLTRNPMYVGLLCLYLGAALWQNNGWALILAPLVAWIVQRIVIEKEERYLEHKFGAAYLQYKARVRRWL